jgi:hypothetical protein
MEIVCRKAGIVRRNSTDKTGVSMNSIDKPQEAAHALAVTLASTSALTGVGAATGVGAGVAAVEIGVNPPTSTSLRTRPQCRGALERCRQMHLLTRPL